MLVGMCPHDQRFKTIFRLRFAELLRVFFPEAAAPLDLDRLEFLDKEFFLRAFR